MWLTGMMSVHGVELLELNIPSDTGSGRAPPVLHTTKPLCAYVCMVEPYKFTLGSTNNIRMPRYPDRTPADADQHRSMRTGI